MPKMPDEKRERGCLDRVSSPSVCRWQIMLKGLNFTTLSVRVRATWKPLGGLLLLIPPPNFQSFLTSCNTENRATTNKSHIYCISEFPFRESADQLVNLLTLLLQLYFYPATFINLLLHLATAYSPFCCLQQLLVRVSTVLKINVWYLFFLCGAAKKFQSLFWFYTFP